MDLIPQTDPHAGYLARKSQIDMAVAQALQSGWYILGKTVEQFEQAFAAYLGVGQVVAVASGTDAIELSLRAMDLSPTDAVLTVSHTAVATVAAIERAGLKPVLVDVDPKRYTLDPASLESTVRAMLEGPLAHAGRPKAVVVVHLYGQPADMPAILEIAERYGLAVIEDVAQAHGAELNGRKVGTFGRLAAFSFYPTKNLGALGDGGAIATSDPSLAIRLRALREYGWHERYISSEPGINSRLDVLQAAILSVQLKYLDRDNDARRAIAQRYDQCLADLADRIQAPCVPAGVKHVYHQYVIQTDRREAWKGQLKSQQIAVGIHYPMAVHQQPAYERLPRLALSGTESLMPRILSLPMFAQLTQGQADRVIQAIRDGLG